MVRIRDGETIEPLLPGQHRDRGGLYPYAYEHAGNVYITYSVGKEDCELAVSPLTAFG